MITTLMAALMLQAAPIDGPVRPLWKNIEAGMTVDEVRALYPSADYSMGRIFIKGYFEVTEGCPVGLTLDVRSKQDPRVDKVVLWAKPRKINGGLLFGGNRDPNYRFNCASLVLQALVEKYGSPVATFDNYFDGSKAGAHTKRITWNTGSASVSLYQQMGSDDLYTIEYEQAAQTDNL